MEVLEVIPSETLKKTRVIPAGESHPARAAAPRALAARVVERPPFDDEAREAELEHVAVLGYN